MTSESIIWILEIILQMMFFSHVKGEKPKTEKIIN